MLYQKKCLLLFFILIATFSTAQESKKDKSNEVKEKDIFLRWNVSSLLDLLEPNVSIGAEYRIKENFSVSLDAGYLFYSQFYSSVDNQNATGFIVRPAVRYYPDSKRRFFIEGEFHFKQVTYQLTDWLQRDLSSNGVPSYQEYTDFKLRKQVFGFNAKLGYVLPLSKDNKIWLEPYWGIGIKLKKLFLLDQPARTGYDYNAIIFTNRNTEIEESVNAALPNMPFGFRLLIKI